MIVPVIINNGSSEPEKCPHCGKELPEEDASFKEIVCFVAVVLLALSLFMGGLFGFGDGYTKYSRSNTRLAKIVFTYQIGYVAGKWLSEE